MESSAKAAAGVTSSDDAECRLAIDRLLENVPNTVLAAYLLRQDNKPRDIAPLQGAESLELQRYREQNACPLSGAGDQTRNVNPIYGAETLHIQANNQLQNISALTLTDLPGGRTSNSVNGLPGGRTSNSVNGLPGGRTSNSVNGNIETGCDSLSPANYLGCFSSSDSSEDYVAAARQPHAYFAAQNDLNDFYSWQNTNNVNIALDREAIQAAHLTLNDAPNDMQQAEGFYPVLHSNTNLVSPSFISNSSNVSPVHTVEQNCIPSYKYQAQKLPHLNEMQPQLLDRFEPPSSINFQQSETQPPHFNTSQLSPPAMSEFQSSTPNGFPVENGDSGAQSDTYDGHQQTEYVLDRICLNHPQYPDLFYCSTHSCSICAVCTIEGIGDHPDTDCELKVLNRFEQENGDLKRELVCQVRKMVNSLWDLLKHLSVRKPFVFDSVRRHAMFNADLLSLAEEDDYVAKKVGGSCSGSATVKFGPIDGSELAKLSKEVNKLMIKCNDHSETDVLHAMIQKCKGVMEDMFEQIKPPASKLYTTLTVSGENSPALDKCYLEGQGLTEGTEGLEGCFYLVVKTADGTPCKYGSFPFDVVAFQNSLGGIQVPIDRSPSYQEGVVEVRYRFPTFGNYYFIIRVNSVDVAGTPISLYVQPAQELRKPIQLLSYIDERLANTAETRTSAYSVQVFQKSSPVNSHFKRPCGLCVHPSTGYIYVTDKALHVVVVLDHLLQVKSTFGSKGDGWGELSGPAGIAVDKKGDVVVCDEGNHRVAVFSRFGKPLRSSDTVSYGNRQSSGQNNGDEVDLARRVPGISRPWSVTVDTENRYIITHSRRLVSRLSSDLQTLEHLNMSNSSDHKIVTQSSGQWNGDQEEQSRGSGRNTLDDMNSIENSILVRPMQNMQLDNIAEICVVPSGVTIGYLDEVLFTDFVTGNIHIADFDSNVMRTKFGPFSEERLPSGGNESLCRKISAVQVDQSGYLFVLDGLRRVIHQFTYAGDLVTSWETDGVPLNIVTLPNCPRGRTRYLVTLQKKDCNRLAVFQVNDFKMKKTLGSFENHAGGNWQDNRQNEYDGRRFDCDGNNDRFNYGNDGERY